MNSAKNALKIIVPQTANTDYAKLRRAEALRSVLATVWMVGAAVLGASVALQVLLSDKISAAALLVGCAIIGAAVVIDNIAENLEQEAQAK